MLPPSSRYCAAMDIGATSAKLGIVSEQGEVLIKDSVPTPRSGLSGPVLEAFSGGVADLIEKARQSGTRLEGIGIGHPGFYDSEGRLRDLCNIPGLNGVNLRSFFQERFRVPVVADTDVTCGTLGEFHFGSHGNVKRFLFLTLGTGVGAGLVIDGKLVRITRNCLGDPGHIIVDAEGRPCTCGGKGCLEAVCSGWAVTQQAEDSARLNPHSVLAGILLKNGSLSPQDVFNAAASGDPVAHDIVTQQARWLALGLASFCAIFEPDLIALGGGIPSGAGQRLLDPVREHLFRVASPAFIRHLEVVTAHVGPDAGLLGAACLVLFG